MLGFLDAGQLGARHTDFRSMQLDDVMWLHHRPTLAEVMT
jgi:hypothetical protein